MNSYNLCMYECHSANSAFISTPFSSCVLLTSLFCFFPKYHVFLIVKTYTYIITVGDKVLKKGDKVFVTGANGCVGRAIIELALLGGAGEYINGSQ